MWLLGALSAAALQISVAPATAEATTVAPPADPRIAQAAKNGWLLYNFDRAAWLSTDALAARIPKDRLAGVGGYVAEAIDAQTLRVTYYRGKAAEARAFFMADVREGKVIRDELLADPVPLTQEQAALADARTIAAKAAEAHAYKPCTPAPFNTVVLPSRKDGPIAVYLLTAQQDARHYPIGGNYRIVVGRDGNVVSTRSYSVACLNMDIPTLPTGARPVGLFLNQPDPVPNEIHVLASFNMQIPLFVGTPDKTVWQVTGSRIVAADVKKLARGL